jgi:hypothetical protein
MPPSEDVVVSTGVGKPSGSSHRRVSASGWPPDGLWRTLEAMTTSPGAARRRLSSSPFQPDPEPVVEVYAVDDLVSHDSYGLGRVTTTDAGGVTVDFSTHTIRITTPFKKMAKL